MKPAVSNENPNPVVNESRRKFALVVVGGILLLGALGLNASASFLKLKFQKQSVPLREPVAAIPAELGPWLQVSVDTRFNAEMEAELGTLDYVERRYVDTRKVDENLMSRWREARSAAPGTFDTDQLLQLRNEIARNAESNDPFASVRLHVAYYTGSVDTVPHIPDRCMLGAGFAAMGPTAVTTLPELRPDGEPLTVSLARFQMSDGRGGNALTSSVAYFFEVNGEYEHDAITGVRKELQNLFESHAYFAKIEVGTHAATDELAPAKEAISDFLLHALPAIQTCLPDWEEIEAAGS